MRPKTFSASAFNVAELCLARYKAEIIERGGGGAANTAATLGTSVHNALELFVQTAIIKQEQEPSLKYLIDLFKMSYMQTFGTADLETQEYLEGYEMLCNWHKRVQPGGVHDFSTFEVISCEIKENFPIKTSIGDIPFNYVWDRHDQLGESEFRVVDYKTNRWGINPADLKKKIQARAYGLAAQIKYPQATRIWVEFDMLRHDGPVGISFSRADNAATWKFFKELAKRIIDTPDDEAEEKLNGECLFCVRKTQCKALLKNIAVGGIHSVSAPEAVDLRAQLEYQVKAAAAAIKELDAKILTEAREQDVMEFESDIHTLQIGVSSRRSIDPEMAEMVIGPELFRKYGGMSLTITNVEKLLKGSELDTEKKKQLKSLIYQKKGEPSVKVLSKNPIDGD